MTFVKGDPNINRNGRPTGAQSFSTKWKKFIDKVAEDTGKTPQEIDAEMYQTALDKARKGDYQFYRDIHDRIYGKPLQSMDLGANVNVSYVIKRGDSEPVPTAPSTEGDN